jgi:mycobactin lysine-N-oxygenase
MARRILILGGGPKAAAIAAKVAALSACNYPAPEIVILEKKEIAANWTGGEGYTDSHQLLGTSPEKDVGYPYVDCFGPEVTGFVRQNFSWHAYLCAEECKGLGDWIDRGRCHPTHGDWGRYLRWVVRKSGARIKIGEVREVTASARVWSLKCSDDDGRTFEEEGDALVVTGPGDSRKVDRQPTHGRLFDGRTFWRNLDQFKDLRGDDAQVCVLGSGETAASIVVELIHLWRTQTEPPAIVVVNRQGSIYSRGESYFENHLFSDPSDWLELEEPDRANFIARTDRGVFSIASMEVINKAHNVVQRVADITEVAIEDDPTGEQELAVLGDYGGRPICIPATYVVIAIGFNPWSFVELFTSPLRERLSNRRTQGLIISGIQDDLSISGKIIPAKLHVPMLAGLGQGPGFPNLSCLGTLADRIIRPHLGA